MIFPSPIHNPRSAIGAPRPGLALPMTIIAVAGLTLLLVGLMTVLTLERKTARSYSNAARADLAIESGLSVALATITEIAKRDDSIVFRVEDPIAPTVSATERPLGFREQFFTYGAVHENGNWRGLPLFSGSSETALGGSRIQADLLKTTLTAYSNEAVQLGRLSKHDQNIPRAKWVDVPAADPKGYNMRYSFWIEDLGGRIDAKHAGSEPSNLGLSTAELDMTTVLNPATASGSVPVVLKDKRNLLRTAASVRPLLSEEQAKRLEPYIQYYAAPQIIRPRAMIPRGFGYPGEGTPAPDLNDFVAAANVEGIASHISSNLPNFSNRKGGFPASEDYLKTLAASIIDYADTDSNATIGTGYRGVDSYPFVNELFDRYAWTGGTPTTVKIEVETFVELWNPSNQDITGVVFFVNQNKHEIRVPPGAAQKFTDSKNYVSPGTTIPANGFRVLSLGMTEYSFPASQDFPPSELIFNETTTSNYSLRWFGRTVDFARGGLQRTSGNLRFGDSARKWKGNSSPALDYSIGQTGDPRASCYVNTWVFANNYGENTNWGGRCLKRSISNTNYNEVRLVDWADSGTNSTPGAASGSDARRPNQVTLPANQPERAPTFISNAGSYNSLGEIGNIFDPAQLTNVNSSTPVGNPNAGGGFTLAIGRPEFGAFDKDGQRSAQLLDLFSIRPDPSASVVVGRPININTAPREVLRALVAGVVNNGDPATPAVVPPTNTDIADVFADFVISQRTVYPLRGNSDLNNIRKNPNTIRNPQAPADTPFFGSRDAYKPGTAPPTSWDDAGREELLRRTLNLVNFTSKTFRIVVAGEARDQSGEVIGRATREYHYSVEPRRNSTTGEILTGTNGNPLLDITKHYEKSL